MVDPSRLALVTVEEAIVRSENTAAFDSTSNAGDRTRPAPFITISRQPGIELEFLAQQLVETLNAQSPPSGPRWSEWDRQLIEKVAQQHGIPVEFIERVEQSRHSWIETLFSDLTGMPDEIVMVHRVRDAVRALAAQGHVVLVGHGSVFMTRDMPGGTHIRLVAPLRHRVATVARGHQISTVEAASRLKQAQRTWTAFLKRFWPIRNLAPETFAATFNTAVLDQNRLVQCIKDLVISPVRDR